MTAFPTLADPLPTTLTREQMSALSEGHKKFHRVVSSKANGRDLIDLYGGTAQGTPWAELFPGRHTTLSVVYDIPNHRFCVTLLATRENPDKMFTTSAGRVVTFSSMETLHQELFSLAEIPPGKKAFLVAQA